MSFSLIPDSMVNISLPLAWFILMLMWWDHLWRHILMNNVPSQGFFFLRHNKFILMLVPAGQACFDLSVILRRDQTLSLKGLFKDEMLCGMTFIKTLMYHVLFLSLCSLDKPGECFGKRFSKMDTHLCWLAIKLNYITPNILERLNPSCCFFLFICLNCSICVTWHGRIAPTEVVTLLLHFCPDSPIHSYTPYRESEI